MSHLCSPIFVDFYPKFLLKGLRHLTMKCTGSLDTIEFTQHRNVSLCESWKFFPNQTRLQPCFSNLWVVLIKQISRGSCAFVMEWTGEGSRVTIVCMNVRRRLNLMMELQTRQCPVPWQTRHITAVWSKYATGPWCLSIKFRAGSDTTFHAVLLPYPQAQYSKSLSLIILSSALALTFTALQKTQLCYKDT